MTRTTTENHPPIKKTRSFGQRYTYLGRGKFAETDLSVTQYVYELLVHLGPSTRPRLSKITKIPLTTVINALSRLVAQDLVDSFSQDRKTPGRPKVYYFALQDLG